MGASKCPLIRWAHLGNCPAEILISQTSSMIDCRAIEFRIKLPSVLLTTCDRNVTSSSSGSAIKWPSPHGSSIWTRLCNGAAAVDQVLRRRFHIRAKMRSETAKDNNADVRWDCNAVDLLAFRCFSAGVCGHQVQAPTVKRPSAIA